MRHYDYSTFPWETYRVMTASDCPEGSEQEWVFCAAVDFVADGMNAYPALVKAEGMLREVGLVNDVELRKLVGQVEKWGKARASWIGYSKKDRDAHAFRQNQWAGTGPVPAPAAPVVDTPMTAAEEHEAIQEAYREGLFSEPPEDALTCGSVDPERRWQEGLAQEDYAALVDLAAGELDALRVLVGTWTKRLRVARAGVGD